MSDMPRVELSNDEYELILREREREEKPSGYCEDYPCCGHTPLDPCTRQWYDHPDAFNPRVNPHALCDHEVGECEVDYYDEPDPATCPHGDVSSYTRSPWGTWYECAYCETQMVPVIDLEQHFFESAVVPGLTLDIPVLVINYKVAA